MYSFQAKAFSSVICIDWHDLIQRKWRMNPSQLAQYIPVTVAFYWTMKQLFQSNTDDGVDAVFRPDSPSQLSVFLTRSEVLWL